MIRKVLKPGGFLILTDYFAASDEEERSHRIALQRLIIEQKIHDGDFYHYDTPLTVDHEREALLAAGFSSVDILKNWGAAYTLKANRSIEVWGDKHGTNEDYEGGRRPDRPAGRGVPNAAEIL